MTTPQHVRVGQLVGLLASDKPGEAAAAAAALNRAIVSYGHDMHWAAEVLVAALAEQPVEKACDAEWLSVDSLSLHRHHKPGSRPTLCVRYRVGASVYFDTLPLEHRGVAREIATDKWRALGGEMPPPLTVDEAIERQDELCTDVEIFVRHDGRYWSVTSQRPHRGVEA
jgi:hypothetical protein